MSRFDYNNQNSKKEIMFNLNEQYFFLVAHEMAQIHDHLINEDYKSALKIIETLFNEQEFSINDYSEDLYKQLKTLIIDNNILIKDFEKLQFNRSINRIEKFKQLNAYRDILEHKIRLSYSKLIGTMDAMGILFKKEKVSYIKPIFEG